ncbi:MAG: DNA mismatch repair endonuclease MutL [Candidatus Muiribacteriota bacterium]
MINKLPVEITSKIAAGEVIHKPFSVVKELIENSIDAESTEIEIEIKDGGRKTILITDNGVGMSKEDLLICYEKHSTSKIKNIEDLEKIYTLGFRGEALYSIAAVSKLEITSRAREMQYGNKVRIEDFTARKIQPVSMNPGTKIEVKNLFYNLPVRLKFLKNSASEARSISEIIIRYMIAFPEIKFRFISNNREVFCTTGKNDLLEVISEIYGNLYVKNLIYVNMKSGDFGIEGYISNLNISKTNSKFQFLFLNKRFIRNNAISYAVGDAYRDYYREKKYPVFFLNVKVPPEKFDVNIHPAKEEVRFLDEREIFSFVRSSIIRTLKENIAETNHTSITETDKNDQNNSDETKYQPNSFNSAFNKNSGTGEKSFSFTSQKNNTEKVQNELDMLITEKPFQKNYKINENSEIETKKFSDFKILGQVKNTYIVAETVEGVVIIDQHVAHERVLYEKYMKKLNSSKIERQRILFPLNIEMKPYEASILEERLDLFEALGFMIEKFGETMFVVKEVPAFMNKLEENTVREIIDEIFTSSYINRQEDLREEIIITSSCKNAIKAGAKLSFEEMELLLNELYTTENPYVCPHGRPVIMKISFDDIYSKFQRNFKS